MDPLICEKCVKKYRLLAMGICGNCYGYTSCYTDQYCGKCSNKLKVCFVCGDKIPKN